MNIGITYDLRDDYLKQGFSLEETAEFDKIDTIDAIDHTLQELGYQTDRIGNVKQLCMRLVKGDRWDLVFNICEGMYGIGREAQAPAVLDAWNIPYVFSDPLVLSLTLHKGMTKRIIRDAGIPTPDFFVVNTPEDISSVDLPFPLFAKPLAEGTGKGINANSVIADADQLRKVCLHLLSAFKQPVLVETFLSGREFTVGITGTGSKARSVAVMEVILKDTAEKNVYSMKNKEEWESLVDYRLIDEKIEQECEKVALDSWIVLGCRDGGRVDIRYDKKGIPNFIEVNPLAGIHPNHSDLPIMATKKGISYKNLIKMIMDSAMDRMSPNY
ncbi:MAG: hypothetical protein R2764_07950 [Bacteroidales bacterium]